MTELLPLVKTFEDGQPRIRDLDLAVALGYERPINIRNLITRKRDLLEEAGILFTVKINSGERGRPSLEYWLTEKQALLLCTWAETDRADEVRLTLVNVFMAYKDGLLVPAEQTVDMSILDVQKRQIVAVVQQCLFPLEKKVDTIQSTMEVGFKTVLTELRGINGKMDVVVDDCYRRRRDVAWEDQARAIDCLRHRRHGICPCCNVTEILNGDGLPNGDFQMDHFFGKHQAKLKEVWPVCAKCNSRLRNSDFHDEHTPDFQAWQHVLEIHLTPPLLRGIEALL